MKTAVVLVALCSCTDSEPERPPGTRPPPSLPSGVTPFAGIDGPDSSDLQPLWSIVGTARFVGLGESVHTSGGFYALKERLIKILIEERGFRTFAMETPRLQTTRLVSYLSGGNCDAPTDQDILRGQIFPVFADDNTAALMRWICHWNVDHPSDPVTFFGFDMQQPVEDHAALTEFLQTYAAADFAALAKGIETCVADDNFEPTTAAEHAACHDGLRSITAYFASHSTELAAAAGARSFRLARLALTSWRAFQDELFYYGVDEVASYEARDAEMAHVFDELVQLDANPNAGVVIWAHDFHLSAAGLPVDGDATAATMGTHLRAMYGDNYRPIAITARSTEINWPGVGSGATAIGTQPSSIEAYLSKFQRPALIVDTHSPLLPMVRMIEGGYQLSELLGEHWDGLLYLSHSPGMDATFW